MSYLGSTPKNKLSGRSRWKLIAFIIFTIIGGASVGASIREDVAQTIDLSKVSYTQSATCNRCHPEHYKSWHKTYHRTMTQTATSEAIVGNFDNATYTYEGIVSRFRRVGEEFYIDTLGSSGRMESFKIVRTVGSRRIQQYITKIGDKHMRLPLAWNIEEKRWFHLNGGFLDPDGTEFNRHLSLWDANCIFCHNVKAAPGYDWQKQTFNSSVSEQGIACEACHGPGKEHIERNENPLRRYFLYYSSHSDKTIISPEKLVKEQQLQVCGHCHGQRKPNPIERIREFMTVGDPFTVGENLNNYTAPLWEHSDLPGVDVKLRFWKDGTPRLTAYEYQGILMSKDYQKGNLTCISCHNMHGGDPKGMINPEMRGVKACAQCHQKETQNIAGHTKHLDQSAGSNCYSCHMPKIAYGILNVHPSHRIQKPDPSRAWRYQMPEACTICHTNKTAVWAAKETSRLFNLPAPQDLPQDEKYSVAENIRALLSGDVVQRAVAIASLSREDSYNSDPVQKLWAVPFLLIAMEDRYSAIRHFGYRSLKTLTANASKIDSRIATNTLPYFDPQASPETRQQVIAQWKNWWSNLDKHRIPHPGREVPLDEQLQPISSIIEPLIANQDQTAISIGE